MTADATGDGRIEGAQKLMREAGIDLLLATPSADLVHLIGYGGHASERPTFLAVPADGRPLIVLPRLEAPRLDSLRDTIGTAIQVNLSMVTIEESETTKRLAAWAGIFAVATAFAGIWGMNFERMPELKWAWGYPASLALIAVTCGLLYYRFKRSGWL